jgi:hypothetical protein
MLTNISRTQFVGAWVAAVIVLIAGSVVAGMELTVSTGQLWLAAGVVPPAIMLFLWRGAPPATVAEVLYAVNSQPKQIRG